MTMIRSPMIDPDYLIHYGRLGMKWGQNIYGKPRVSSGKKRKKTLFSKNASKKTSKRSKKSVKKKKIKDMTDSELMKKRDRLRLEKEVRILEDETGSTARKIGKKAISRASEKVVEEIVHDVTKYAIASVINKYAGAKVINLKGGDDDNKKKKKEL